MSFAPIADIATTSAVPEATITSKGFVGESQTQLGLIEGADGNYFLRVLAEFPLDENRVGARLGKKDKEGNQNVTSRIYSKSSNQAVYAADPEGNVMQLAARLFAPVEGASDNDAADDVEV